MNEKNVMSDMSEFEKQLNDSNVIDLDDSPKNNISLSEDKINSIDGTRKFKNQVVQQSPSNSQQNENMIKVQKNIILAFISDATGCGFIRCHIPFSYLNFVFGKDQKLLPIISPCFIQDQNILLRTRTIYFQRQMSPQHLSQVRWYKEHQKQFHTKLVWEMDDAIWTSPEDGTHNVPDWNFGKRGITKEVQDASIEIMKLMDQLIVSTQPLADIIQNHLKIQVPVKVIKNHVPKFFWKDGSNKKITEKINKPKFIITSSPTHFSNENRHLGDFDNNFREFIIKNVKERKIELTCFGGEPWFFSEIKKDIKIINWLNSYQYHTAILNENAHFGLMPLVPHYFNFCKSNLKFLEFAAAKVLGIGCYFKEGYPYQGPYADMPVKLDWKCSVKEIEEIVEFYSQPENYNKVINQQLKYLDDNGHWLESPKWVNEFMSVL